MFVPVLGKPKAIAPDLWVRMEQSWADAFPKSAAAEPRGSAFAPAPGSEAVEPIDEPSGEKTKALLEAHAPAITTDDLVDLLAPGASRIQPADFDRATAVAVDLFARHYVIDKNPGLDPERYRREMGGYVVTGYLIGRRLLGTHAVALQYSRSGVERENGSRLFATALTLDRGTVGGPFLGTEVKGFIQTYAEYESEIGELALVADRDAAGVLLIEALLDGLFLAFGEHELFG